MDSLSEDLVKMEYERLGNEIFSLIIETNQLARYAVIASAAVFSFTLTRDKCESFYPLLKSLPFIISILFGFRVYAIYRRIELLSMYIENHIEKALIKQKFQQLGWETYLNNNIRNAKYLPKSLSQVATILFWSGLLLITGIFLLV